MKNVLILGASGDIGSAIAKQLANEGYSLILHYFKSTSSIEQLVNQLDEQSVLQIVQADLTSNEGVRNLCNSIAFSVHAIIFISGTTFSGFFKDLKEKKLVKR